VLSAQTREQIVERIRREFHGEAVTLYAPAIRGRKGTYTELFRAARKLGFGQARIDGHIQPVYPPPAVARYQEHDIDIVVAALAITRREGARLADVVATALRYGSGALIVASPQREHIYSERLYCPRCSIGYEELDPRLFSFNSSQGACPHCDGIGSVPSFEPELLIADPQETVAAALATALRPLGGAVWRAVKEIGEQVARAWERPLARLTPAQRARLFFGDGDGKGGVLGVLQQQLERDDVDPALLAPFMSERSCEVCKGRRLNARAQAVTVAGEAIWELTQRSVAASLADLSRRRFKGRDEQIAPNILKEIVPRLQFLREVGLGYLTLDRRADTLSGGEAQRIRLAAQLGSNLRGVCYILDEPTIGLHPRDNAMLLGTLTQLKDHGNTVVVVEHDEATIEAADLVVDLGHRQVPRATAPAVGPAARGGHAAPPHDPRRRRAQSETHRRRDPHRGVDLCDRRVRLR
jgi:excinuclease ABC subunit A